MPETDSVLAADAETIKQTLGGRTVVGVFWLLLQMLGSKGVTVIGQIVLAWLLSKEDFGLIALVLTVASFAGVAQQIGVRQVLIQKGGAFSRWANAGFWLSLTAGLIGALCMLAIAPLAAAVYKEQRLIVPICILAIAVPLESLWVVPSAQLSRNLRFDLLAKCGLFNTLSTTALTVLLASCGFGVFSFVIPRPIVASVQAAILWHFAPVSIRRTLNFGCWRFMLRDALLLMGVSLFTLLLLQGDYLLLGLTASTAAVGVYYFAYSLSSQTLQLVSATLGTALFPALATLQADPARQMKSCIKACRVLALFGIPACFIQAAVGEPVIRLLFADKWSQAVPIFQVLSIGMSMTVAGTAATSFMQAQGRFRLYLNWTVICALFFMLHVAVGVMFRDVFAVSVAVAVFYLIFGPLGLYTAIRPAGGKWRDVASVYLVPLFLATLATLVAIGTVKLTGIDKKGALFHSISLVIMASGLYFAGAIRFARDDLRLLWERVRPLTYRILVKEL